MPTQISRVLCAALCLTAIATAAGAQTPAAAPVPEQTHGTPPPTPPSTAEPSVAGPAPAAPAVPPTSTTPEAAESPKALPQSGEAQRYVDELRTNRLEAALAEVAQADLITRRWGGVGAALLGGVTIAAGVFVAVDNDATWGNGDARAALSGIAMAGGAGMIAGAIYRWVNDTPGEERLARWSELRRAGKLDDLEFGRFEGELASAAEIAGSVRSGGVAGALGLIAGGGALIGFAASSELEDNAEDAGYGVGTVLAVLGACQVTALLLTRAPAEQAWRHYTDGEPTGFGQLREPHLGYATQHPSLALEAQLPGKL